MAKSRYSIVIMVIACFCLTNCNKYSNERNSDFDELSKTVNVDNWQFALNVENQNKRKGIDSTELDAHYLKATLYLSNTKTKKSLLYSISDNAEDYEVKYKYLSFGSKDDLFIKHNDDFIYPIGYVFEPSNGLSNSERLVYKFQIDDVMYKQLKQGKGSVEYWYIDRLTGLGKICFTHNN